MREARAHVVGFASEPKQRVTQSGKHLLDVSVAHTPRRKNDRGEWEDVTDRDGKALTLWVRATFFDDEADHLIRYVSKGTLVRLEGEPRLSAYFDGAGQPRASLELHRPALAIIPRAPHGGSGVSSGPGAGVSSSGDAFAPQVGAQDFGGFPEEQPF